MKKFILCVPELGETIQINQNGKYRSGEEFHRGDPVKYGNEIISGTGIAFYNRVDDQWVAAISGLKGINRHVIVLNEVNEGQAIELQKKIDEHGDPEKVTIPQLKDILSYAESLGLMNRYPSTVGYINEMMENVRVEDQCFYGWKQRKGTQICRASYIEGAGELQQAFGESEKFYHGALIVKHPTGKIHVIASDVGFRTYSHLNNTFINKNDVPLQEVPDRGMFQTSHVITSETESTTVVIVGAGVSGILAGTSLIEEFLRLNPPGQTLQIHLIDSLEHPGGSTYNRPASAKINMANPIGILGIESATACLEHLNKDPNKWMNIFPQLTYTEGQGFDPNACVSHTQYGQYLRDHFQSKIKLLERNQAPVHVQFIHDRVIKSTDQLVSLGSGKRMVADAIIYALGNANPKPLKDINGKELSGRNGYYNLDDHAFTPENVNETDFTVIVGTGNGACFAALWAVDHGYQGRFLLVSREGKLPYVAEQSKPYTRKICVVEKTRTADELMELFTKEIEVAKNEGFTWRDVIDSLFMDTNTLWRAMNKDEQRRFIDKYGRLWSNGRYRIPNEQWEEVNKLRQQGRLEICSGLQSIIVDGDSGFNLTIQNADGSIRIVHTNKLVNNTGPSRSFEQMPVCAKELVSSGLAQMHHQGGLDVDDQFRLINADGQASSRLYALGPTVSGAHIESITIPAVRCNASIMAKSLIQDHTQGKSPGFHYSGYDHRPYDYSTMSANALSEEFKRSRFARSLTNIYPRHYTTEEKDQFYTIEFAEKALATGQISAPADRTVLWSGGHIPSHPLGYGLSRILVERWLVEKNAQEERCAELYHTVAMTEAGLPVLNPMWDDMSVPLSVKKAVTPTYILGFAACAIGEISLNVDDTDIDSFFRENELAVVMQNPNITSVRVIRVNRETDVLEETIYVDRHHWYNAQKDQWVNSIIKRYQLARRYLNSSLYERMSKALAEEFDDSYRNMTNGNKLIAAFHTAVGKDYSRENEQHDKALEMLRLKKLLPVVDVHPQLLNDVQLIL